MDWIDHKKQQPEDRQKVWYFYDVVGVHKGEYELETDCFSGRGGFLCEDVTHWMPDTGQETPDKPEVK